LGFFGKLTMKKRLNIWLLVLPVVVCSFFIYYRYRVDYVERLAHDLKEEFPAITFEDSVEGIVTKIVPLDSRTFRTVPDRVLIILNDSLKRRIRAGVELNKKTIRLYDGTVVPSGIGEVLQEGDRIVKESRSLVVSVNKTYKEENVVYQFELKDDLGYPIGKK
jgi:hypothetical protein